MDSLLASYASDEEDEVEEHKENTAPAPSKPISLALPKPSFDASPASHDTPFFSSLPPPKASSSPSSFSSIFSSLPHPVSNQSLLSKPINPSSLSTQPKRVIQFTPRLNPIFAKPSSVDDEDDQDEEDDEKPKKPTKDNPCSAPKPFLTSALPPPKNSIGLPPPKRTSIDSNALSEGEKAPIAQMEKESYLKSVNYDSNLVKETPVAPTDENVIDHARYEYYQGNCSDDSSTVTSETYSSYVPTCENFSNYGCYEGNFVDNSAETMTGEASTDTRAGILGMTGKRRRNEIPADIIEVKQDELMSNRPREDQVKLTGIAFGPSYQPVSSAKGKPSKLHKRKHQIGSLYFDMKQKEMELAERRAKGLLTKSQTQGKYGW